MLHMFLLASPLIILEVLVSSRRAGSRKPPHAFFPPVDPHSRVILKTKSGNDLLSSYINANYIRVHFYAESASDSFICEIRSFCVFGRSGEQRLCWRMWFCSWWCWPAACLERCIFFVNVLMLFNVLAPPLSEKS